MPISSLAQTQQIIQNLTALQNQGFTLQQQIATGIKSQTYDGYAPQAERLVNLNATQAQQQSYIDTINTVSTRLQTMSLATSTMATDLQTFAGELQTNAYNASGATIQTQAKGLLAQIGDYLNTQDGEGYVFSGSLASTAPYDPTGLPNPGDLATPVNGAPPNGYFAGNTDIAQARIDTGVSVPYGVTADNTAFEQAIRVLNFLANSGPFDQTNAADVANVNAAEQLLNTAVGQIQQVNAQVGFQQSELDNALQAHQQSLTLAKGQIGDIENVDSATVITQLNALQTQMQASYQTVSILQGLSLANYLK
jgi:flagellar hook-associated protein 3 FlgL